MSELDYLANGVDCFVNLAFGDDEGRRKLQNHEIVTANLSQDPVVPEEPHHENLAEHRGVNSAESLIRDA